MKLLSKHFLVTLLLAVFAAGQLHGQWKRVDGPPGGSIGAITVLRTDVYAGVSGGTDIYRSTDSGATWMAVDGGQLQGNLESLAAIDSNVVVSMGDSLYRSSDRGVSWAPVNKGSMKQFVRILQTVGTRLYAITSGGIFWSTGAAGSWTAASSGITDSTSVIAICAADSDLFAGTYSHLYRSTNGGASWARADSGLPKPWINTFQVQGTKLFAGGEPGLYVSTDRGRSWASTGPDLADVNVQTLAVSGQALLAGGGTGLYRSTDSGATWSRVTAGLPAGLSNSRVTVFASLGPRLFAGLVADGVYVSTDDGASWSEANRGIRSAEISCLTATASGLLAGTQDALFRSTDSGVTWHRSATGLTDTTIRCLALAGTAVLAGTQHGIFRSTNEGAGWSHQGPGVAETPITGFGVQGTTVIAGFYGGAFISRDGGIGWDSVKSELTGKIPYLFAATDSAIFATSQIFGLFVSRDGGTTWRLVSPGQTTDAPFAVTVVGRAVLMATSAALLRSLDNGDTWTAFGRPPGGNLFVIDLAGAGNTLFAATLKLGITDETRIWSSSDLGNSWTDVSAGLNISGVQMFQIAGDNLYCVPYQGGLWRRPIKEMVTSVDRVVGPVATTYSLEQNYPNPFNPTTTIRYSLPKRSHVTLTLFSTLGQKVAELVNGEIDVGSHELRFNAGNVASGVYFYRLQAGGFVDVKKLTIVK